MRIAYFTGVTFWGGGEVYLKMLFRRVRSLDCEIILFCRKGLTVERLFGGQIPSWASIRHIDDLEKQSNPIRRILAYSRLFRRESIDLIHFNGHDYKVAAIAARCARVPTIVGTYHVLPDLGQVGPVKRAKEFLYARCLHSMIFNCESSRKQWQRAAWLPSTERTTLIHNGVEVDEMEPPGSEARLRFRRELGIANDALVVGMVARLHPMKGHLYLVDASVEVVRAFPRSRFVLAGDGPDEGIIKQRIVDNGLEEYFLFTGFLEDAGHMMGACDVIAVPSLYKETCSLTSLEAMAHGRPLVVSEVGGLPEIVRNGVTGRIVETANSGQLAAALTGILGDHEEMARMGRNGRDRVCRHFSAELMASNTFDVYRTQMWGDHQS